MIGISYHSGGMADRPLLDVIEHLSDAGYDAVEIVCGPKAHIRPDEITPSQLSEIKAALREKRLSVSAVNPFTVKPLTNMAREGFAEAERFYTRLMELAVELDAPTVNFLTGWVPEGDREGWAALISALKPLTHRAASIGVCMSIHNHEANVVDTSDKVLLLIRHVEADNLKSLCDITNFYILGEDIPTAVRKLGPHLIHCHVKGVLGLYPYNHFLVPGETGDELDFDAFARTLGEVGYSRCISVETFPHMRADKAEVACRMMSRTLTRLGLRI